MSEQHPSSLEWQWIPVSASTAYVAIFLRDERLFLFKKEGLKQVRERLYDLGVQRAALEF